MSFRDRRVVKNSKNQLKSKIRFLKKPDGWPGPARAFHVRASPHGPARAGRAFFQPGLARAGLSKTARAGPGGPCANTNFYLLLIQNQFILNKID